VLHHATASAASILVRALGPENHEPEITIGLQQAPFRPRPHQKHSLFSHLPVRIKPLLEHAFIHFPRKAPWLTPAESQTGWSGVM